MQDRQYADIIIEISHEQLDRPFQYRVPEALTGVIRVGDCVTVPFGRANKAVSGYCIELKDHADYPEDKLKAITDIRSDLVGVDGRMIALAWWIRVHYGGTMIQALKTVLPVKKKMTLRSARQVDLILEAGELKALIEECSRKHQTARLRVLSALLNDPTLPYDLVRDKLNVTAPTIRSLEEKGYIRVSETEYYRNPVVTDSASHKTYELSDRQQEIITAVTYDFDCGAPGKYLIHGITGSGKTEVYIGITDHMVRAGYQVIVLIPEISLTYQTLLRFYRRFGDRVSVVNSSLSDAERADQWERARRGEIDVIIGPRSALFTPFPNPGVIVIDEEHERTYRSDTAPRYDTREVAAERARMSGAYLVLGSATPSLESYTKALRGEYALQSLTSRARPGALLPRIHVADMRRELEQGNRSVFSRVLRELIEGRTPPEAEVFDPGRASAGVLAGLKCEGGHALKGLSRSLLQVPRDTVDRILPGRGGLVQLDGQKLGVYRDEDGKVWAVNVRCPHLGCQLEWNPDEGSWDCPCHGSRFDHLGNLISGPAQEGLKHG